MSATPVPPSGSRAAPPRHLDALATLGCENRGLASTLSRRVRCGRRIPRHGAAFGFTLIELLVAMVIVAVLAGAVVISLPGMDARRGEREAERLTALLRLACEQAELSGREIGLHLAETGYGFSQAVPDGWRPYPDGHRFGPRELEAVILVVPDRRLALQPQFDAEPQVRCWPSGELSDLDVRVQHGERSLVRVRTLADGVPVMERSDDGRRWQPAP